MRINRISMSIVVIAALMAAGLFIAMTDTVSAAGDDLKMQITSSQNRPDSRFKTKVWNVPDDFPEEDKTEFLSWCIEKDNGLPLGKLDTTYDAKMYDSYSSDVPDGSGERFEGYDWNRINYMINNRDGVGSDDVQEAIWNYAGHEYTGSDKDVKDLIDDADDNGGSFEPEDGDLKAYILVPYKVYYPDDTTASKDDFQALIIQVDYEEEDDEIGARTIGYWKNHNSVWDDWEPDEDSVFEGNYDKDEGLDQDSLLDFFPGGGKDKGKGASKGGVYLWEMVRAQLLAAELNIYFFSDEGTDNDWDFDYSLWTYDNDGIDDWMDEATDFLKEHCTISNGEWTGPDYKKKSCDYKDYKSEGEDIKDALDDFNNIGDEVFE